MPHQAESSPIMQIKEVVLTKEVLEAVTGTTEVKETPKEETAPLMSVPVASLAKESITEEDIEQLFPALRKLRIIKDDDGAAEAALADYKSFVYSYDTLNEQMKAAIVKEAQVQDAPHRKGYNPYMPSLESRQEMLITLDDLRYKEERLRRRFGIIESWIYDEKMRMDALYSALLRMTQHKKKIPDRALHLHEKLAQNRANGYICNAGYERPVDLTCTLWTVERPNVRVILPKATKEDTLEYIEKNYKKDLNVNIVIGGEGNHWYNLITGYLKEDITNFMTSTHDVTDWRRVYQYFEHHGKVLTDIVPCEYLKQQLDSKWTHREVLHSVNVQSIQDQVEQEGKQKAEQAAMKAQAETIKARNKDKAAGNKAKEPVVPPTKPSSASK